MATDLSPPFWQVAKKQIGALSLFFLLFAFVSVVLYSNDRRQEWRLRSEQAAHQLQLAFQLIDRDLERVRADVRFVSNQQTIRDFHPDDDRSRSNVEYEFKSFLISQQTFQQIRLLDLAGQEIVRVDWRDGTPEVIERSELQNKKDRYYVRESLRLKAGEVFVSEFDLNQERGEIEQPLSPVIRFVTPVCEMNGEKKYLLVVNYLGAPLLQELGSPSLPGKVFLIRGDGHYLLGPTAADAWGWLLGHTNSFDRQFKEAWAQRNEESARFFLTPNGAFAFHEVQMNRFVDVESHSDRHVDRSGNTLFVTSYFRSSDVFKNSRRLLNRLIVLFAIILLPLYFLTRFWANASVRRMQQNRLIQESERKLRELSARLVRIQEEERKAISREIHDQFGQLATAINLDLKLAAQESVSDSVREQLTRAIRESEQLLETLHDFASRVRPVELDDLGLCDAIESYLGCFGNRTGIDCHFESNLNEADLPAEICENVFRLVQESLNNVMKHSKATRVDVSVRLIDNTQGKHLELRVCDDGVGATEFQDRDSHPVNAGASRLGVLGMRERVDLLGGLFCWKSGVDTGTTVDVIIPVHRSIEFEIEKLP